MSGTSGTVTLSKVIVTDNSIQTATGEAVYLRGVRDVVVSGNILDTGVNTGVNIDSGVSASIFANNLLRGGTGNNATAIALGGGALDINSDLVINGNQISGYGTGLSLANTTNQSFSRVSIASNTFTGITGSAVRLFDGTDVIVSKNQVNGGTYGIEVNDGVRGLTRLSVTGNVIGGSSAGVRLNSRNLTDLLLDSNTFSAGTAVQTQQAPLGRFLAASNLGWKGPSSGLHAGRNTSGSCTISAGSMFCGFPSGSVPEPNLEYRVVLTPVSSNLTTANLPKQRITTVAKATNGFTLTTEVPLTAGDSVQYDWVLLRDPV